MLAHNVWEYRHTPDRYSYWMGNAQRLPNGNTFICWADGSLPKVTEVTPEKEVVYEADFKEFFHCYRGFRFDWHGLEMEPGLIAEKDVDKISLIYHKFGDTSLVSYNVYADTFPDPVTLLANTRENYINLDKNQLLTDVVYYFMVKAVYADSSESEASNGISVLTDFILAGENLVKNHDFSSELFPWIFDVTDDAKATGIIDPEGKFIIKIDNAGLVYDDIQLKQTGLPLIQGKQYELGFDVIATAPRIIEAKVTQSVFPFSNYSKNGLSQATEELQHFKYNFTMVDPSDFNASLVINCGNDTAGLIIDNVYLKEPSLEPPASVGKKIPPTNSITLYPNPAQDVLNISIDIQEPGKPDIVIFDSKGKMIKVVQYGHTGENPITIQENISDLDAGVYVIAVREKGIVIGRRVLIVQ